MNFYFPWKCQKTYGYLLISGKLEINQFAQICLMLKAKFGYVIPFLVDVACLYPLQASEKIPSVSDLLRSYIEI